MPSSWTRWELARATDLRKAFGKGGRAAVGAGLRCPAAAGGTQVQAWKVCELQSAEETVCDSVGP